MATDGPTPPPCDSEIFQYGETIAILSGSSNAIERWVKKVAAEANARIDWHYTGGRANVLHLGDEDSRGRAYLAMGALLPEMLASNITILHLGNDVQLYRAKDGE